MAKREILVGLTGYNAREVNDKIEEVNSLKIKRVALFLELLKKSDRKKVYEKLLKSQIRSIPLVHIRHDMSKDELRFFVQNFKSKFLTIHESCFEYLSKWKGFHRRLFLEMNYDSKVSSLVKVKEIGGFCIDLSHFKAGEERWSREFEYILKRRDKNDYFACNHLNGYSYRKNCDLHTIKSVKDFDYLKTLPKFIFGRCISLEVFNSIRQQLKFREYLAKFLS